MYAPSLYVSPGQDESEGHQRGENGRVHWCRYHGWGYGHDNQQECPALDEGMDSPRQLHSHFAALNCCCEAHVRSHGHDHGYLAKDVSAHDLSYAYAHFAAPQHCC